MSFVSSLLQAIVRLDGEAVVLHVGEKPYIVTPTEQVDLATKGLTIDAAVGILNQLLPPEPQNALEEFGAVQYQMPPSAGTAGRALHDRGGSRRRRHLDRNPAAAGARRGPRAARNVRAAPAEAVPATSSRSEQKPLLPPRERVALPPLIPEAPSAVPSAVAPTRPHRSGRAPASDRGRSAPRRSLRRSCR